MVGVRASHQLLPTVPLEQLCQVAMGTAPRRREQERSMEGCSRASGSKLLIMLRVLF